MLKDYKAILDSYKKLKVGWDGYPRTDPPTISSLADAMTIINLCFNTYHELEDLKLDSIESGVAIEWRHPECQSEMNIWCRYDEFDCGISAFGVSFYLETKDLDKVSAFMSYYVNEVLG